MNGFFPFLVDQKEETLISAGFNYAATRLRARVTCPHCWHSFPPHESLWISQHPDLLGDPRLGKEQQLRFLPSRFTVEGNALDSEGVVCHDIACPNCHLAIPRALLEMGSLFFSILGTPASGKSYFLAVMTWQLRKTIATYFKLSFGDADPAINQNLNSYEELLFHNPDPDKLVALAKTDLQGDHLYDSVQFNDQVVIYPRPYVFGLRPMDGHPNFRQLARASRAVCVYDNAGEHFLPGADKTASPVTRHLALSRVLFFLFDPTQDPRMRSACSSHANDPQLKDRARTYRQDLVLHEAAERVRRHCGLAQSAQHTRPLVVIVTKFDVWRHLLDGDTDIDTSQVLQPGRDGFCAVSLTAVEQMSRKVRAVLLKHCPEFVGAAEGFCKEIVYVPVSALGRSPEPHPDTGQLCIRPRDIAPIWVEVPMFYALARLNVGLVPYVHQPSPGRMVQSAPSAPTAPARELTE